MAAIIAIFQAFLAGVITGIGDIIVMIMAPGHEILVFPIAAVFVAIVVGTVQKITRGF